MLKKFFVTIFLCFVGIFGQPNESLNSSAIKLALKKLNTLGSVLYIAAHPDDENTEFLSYSNYGILLRTGYLSLTRGDGGQNLIGEEQGDLLGVLRTQELLQARKIDGAEQFFTRAIDFGYSKTSDETFSKWGKEEILSDVVWVIRKFKPDIIVTRFPVTGEGRHGQHTASAILALEAFNISNDPDKFPEQLKYVEPWQAKRIFWNAWTPALKSMGIDGVTLIRINLGAYNQLLGKSYTEISAESRTMHKSQGFGDSGWRQNYYNYFLQLEGEHAFDNIFEGIDLTWDRIPGGHRVNNLLTKAERSFNFEEPQKIIPLLVEAYEELQKLEDDYWINIKSKELMQVIKSCAGIWTEAVADEYFLTRGKDYTIETGIVNRTESPFILKNIQLSYQKKDSSLNASLIKGEMIKLNKVCTIPYELPYSQPYWLNGNRQKEIYDVKDQILIGLPKTNYPLYVAFTLEYEGKELILTEPVYYRKNDPVKGEVYRSIEIVPQMVINFNKDLYTLTNENENPVSVTVKCLGTPAQGKLMLIADDGWKVSPEYADFDFTFEGEEQLFDFSVIPKGNSKFSNLKAEISLGDLSLNRGLFTIEYPHIQTQTVIPVAHSKIIKLEISDRSIDKIGYIMGSGDKIPIILSDLGFNLTLLNGEEFNETTLENFDVIITGIRAFNTNKRLQIFFPQLLDYVYNGGTLIVQYNTFSELPEKLGPYELTISRNRVTEEDSPVKILDENHPLLNFPNKISEDDFNGWIQERGLYFPGDWAQQYDVLLEMNDSNSEPLQGSLLFCKYGKGNFIYTGLSFFRQLPAGVSGAYRLFINLLSAGKY